MLHAAGEVPFVCSKLLAKLHDCGLLLQQTIGEMPCNRGPTMGSSVAASYRGIAVCTSYWGTAHSAGLFYVMLVAHFHLHTSVA